MATGEARYRLTVDASAFDKALEESRGQFEAFASVLQGIGVGAGIELFKGIEEAIGSMVGAIPSMVAQLGHASEALLNLHERTGISTEALQQWKFAGEVVGVGVDEMAAAVGKFDKGLDQMTPKVVESLQRIGLSAKDVAKMSDDMKVDTVMEHLGRIEAGGTRTALAMELFGKAGAQMLPLAAQFGSLREAADALGVVMDEKVLKAAADLDDRMDMLRATGEGLRNNFVSVIVTSEPLHVLMETLVKTFGNLSIWVKNNNEVLRQWVDSGIVFVAQAFVQAVKVVEVGGAAFKALGDIWTYALRTAKDLGAGLLLLNEVMAAKTVTEVKAAWEEYGKTVSRTEIETKTALAAHQASLITFMGVTGQVKNAGEALVTNLAAQAGKHHEVATAIGVHVAAGKDLAAQNAREKADLDRLIFLTKEWAKEQNAADAAVAKATADDVRNFAATSAAFTQMQNQMTLANATGYQKRMAQVEIAYQAERKRIADLKIENADELTALVALATANYAQAKDAALGYFSSASQYAEANGLKTREEMQHTVDVTKAGYEAMKESGLFTYGELTKAKKAETDAENEMEKNKFEAVSNMYDTMAGTAKTVISGIFGHSKGAAIATGIIDIGSAVLKTLAAYPYPWNLIPAAAVAIAGAVQLSHIKSQSFAVGTPRLGFVDFGPATQVELHGREAVVPESRASEFAAMHGGGGRSGPTEGDVYLDGMQVGRWFKRYGRAGLLAAPA